MRLQGLISRRKVRVHEAVEPRLDGWVDFHRRLSKLANHGGVGRPDGVEPLPRVRFGEAALPHVHREHETIIPYCLDLVIDDELCRHVGILLDVTWRVEAHVEHTIRCIGRGVRAEPVATGVCAVVVIPLALMVIVAPAPVLVIVAPDAKLREVISVPLAAPA